MRSAYELIRREGVSSTSVGIAYEKVPVEQIPTLELRSVFYNDGNFLRLGVGTVSLGICWPAELTIPAVAGQNAYSNSCALSDWPSNKRPRQDNDVTSGRHSISLRSGTADKITWGPISIAYTALDKNRISAKVETFAPLGAFASQAKSVYVMGMDIANEIYVLNVRSLATEGVATAQNEGRAP